MRTIKSIALPRKRLLIGFAVLTVLLYGIFIYGHAAQLEGTVKNQQTELKSTEVKLYQKQDQLKQTNQTLQKVQVEKDAHAEQVQKLEQEKKDLEAQLQAKLDKKAADAAAQTEVAVAASTISSLNVTASAGSGCDWVSARLSALGVTASDLPAAIYIASHESGCRPEAQNSGGACNVFQELPCGKWGGLGNTDAHLLGAIAYATARYGGWQGAYSFWVANNWW